MALIIAFALSSADCLILLNGSNSYLTNIRLYDVSNNELDKQITDLVSYNTPYNSHAIINDTVDTPLNNEYIGEQR